MNTIEKIEDLHKLVIDNNSAIFLVDPKTIISNDFQLYKESKSDKSYRCIFNYKIKDSESMHIIVENNIVVDKTFYNNDLNYLSSRDHDLPTEISYELNGVIKNLSWRKGLESYRNGDFKPTNIRYSGDNIMFTYDNKKTKNNKICLSYITYNIKRNRIIDANMKFFKQVLDFRRIIDEFPEIINANELDCHDLSVNILTKNVITFKEMLNI